MIVVAISVGGFCRILEGGKNSGPLPCMLGKHSATPVLNCTLALTVSFVLALGRNISVREGVPSWSAGALILMRSYKFDAGLSPGSKLCLLSVEGLTCLEAPSPGGCLDDQPCLVAVCFRSSP